MSAVDGLGQRVLTAVILVPLVVAAVLALPTSAFAVAAAAFALLGAWEWAALAGWRAGAQRLGFVLAVALSLVAICASGGSCRDLLAVTALAGLAWWLVPLVWIVRYEQGVEPDGLATGAARFAAGWLTLVPAWAALVYLHGAGDGGPRRVLFVLVLVWAADIGAYFAGRRFGERRLAARVSPGKSVEGVCGGLVPAVVLGLGAGVALGLDAAVTLALAALCVATALVSVLGDLAESLYKRRAGVKDSGTLLPGHGGVLDRIDSVTAAGPFFAIGYDLVSALR